MGPVFLLAAILGIASLIGCCALYQDHKFNYPKNIQVKTFDVPEGSYTAIAYVTWDGCAVPFDVKFHCTLKGYPHRRMWYSEYGSYYGVPEGVYAALDAKVYAHYEATCTAERNDYIKRNTSS
jgi:hypothetical protein